MSSSAFCNRYANLNERGYEAFAKPIRTGRVDAVEGA
jgi:hypothetical protein